MVSSRLSYEALALFFCLGLLMMQESFARETVLAVKSGQGSMVDLTLWTTPYQDIDLDTILLLKGVECKASDIENLRFGFRAEIQSDRDTSLNMESA